MMRLLVVKVGGLGDSLALLPSLAALREFYPKAEISVLCSAIGKDVFAAIPRLRIVTVSRTEFRGLRGLMALRPLRQALGLADIALIAHDQTTVAHILAACCAPIRIGFRAHIAKGEHLLTVPLPWKGDRSVYHLARDLVCSVASIPASPPFRLLTSPAVDSRFRGRYGIIHPGAATPWQRWEGFARLASLLADKTGYPWYLLSEEDGFSLAELVGVLDQAQGFVGCHSGPFHLAAALGVPALAVAGPTAPAWDPPFSWARVLRRGLSCQPCATLARPARHCANALACLALSPETVLEAVLDHLRTVQR